MKLDELPERLRNPPVINPAYVEALEQRLAYAKALFLSHGIDVSDRAGQQYFEKVDAFIEKLNSEGL